MANTVKPASDLDANQTLQHAFNDSDASFTTSTFLTAQLGNNIQRSIINGNTDNYSYYDGVTGALMYTIQVVYDDDAHDNVNSVTRIT
jgi:hypothetical protein